MSARVGIHRSTATSYSDDWRDADTFPEKEQLRSLSRLLGNEDGNLFADAIEPGQKVLVKPNWVLNRHPRGDDVFAVITHSAVLRAVVDLVYECLQGEGSITIADAPQWNCDFDHLLQVTEVERIRDLYERRNFEVGILDLRKIGTRTWGVTRQADRVELAGDPAGYSVANLGSASAFVGMPHEELVYGADYNRSETREHHHEGKHEYLISRSVLEADTFVHVPKLKVHKRVGVTLNAKGMVGINGHKNWIAHYRVGPPSSGGDEYPDEMATTLRLQARMARLAIDRLLAPGSRRGEATFVAIRRVYKLLKPVLGPFAFTERDDELPAGGNWHGNDTAWRMTADLARIALFADAAGVIHDSPQRRFFSVVDGIVAGEDEGPLAASPKPCGVLAAGDNLLGVDLVCTRLMGFDWRKVRSLHWLLDDSPHDMGVSSADEIEICSNEPAWESLMRHPDVPDLAFRPHAQWMGHLELDRPESQLAVANS